MLEYRCPSCRTRRQSHALFTQHLRDSGHKLCHCGGYEWGPHRPGSPCCTAHPMSPVHQAARQGASAEVLEELEMECVWSEPGRPMREWPGAG